MAKASSNGSSERSRQQNNNKKLLSSTSPVMQVVLGVLVGFVAIAAYRKYCYDQLRDRLDGTLNAMLEVEKSFEVNREARIAVGYGSCIDVVADAQDVLPSPPGHVRLKHHDTISNEDQLLESFGYFFSHGAAAERYVSNKVLFGDLLAKARSSVRSRESLGGNAPVMANRFFKEGIKNILLGSVKTPDLMSYLPEGIVLPDEDNETQSDLNANIDHPLKTADVHLLLEYPTGANWGHLTSPRANRFIVHSDKSNPMMVGLEKFHSMLAEFRPNLLVVSGLQMLDNFPYQQDQGHSRIDKLSSLLQDLRMSSWGDSTLIHFEMASFTDERLLKQVITDILPMVDSIGMNEQELPNLSTIFSVGNITLISNPYPRTAIVLDQMRDVFVHLDHLSSGRISRLHVHTLAFQAVMTRKGTLWKNGRASATKAALTAHRHTCGHDEIDVDKAKLIMDDSFTTTDGGHRIRIQFDPAYPVPCWEESMGSPISAVEICVAPVLVCTNVLQTGGGGDNVSAAGLVITL